MNGRLFGILALSLLGSSPGFTQPQEGTVGTPREAAPFDLEGYWVSVVTEDWMFRMVTPPKGETLGVPLNAVGRQEAAKWDPAKDAGEGNGCKAFGAGGVMRLPGRLHIDWEDEDSLRLRMEAGAQERVLHFGNVPEGAASLQGRSQANWEIAPGEPRSGKLVVQTDSLLPGYLRLNGVPYSSDTRISEFWSVYGAPNGDTWLVVTTEVTDPAYLTTPFVTSSHFKKLDASEGERHWKPESCMR